ncbi:MAG: hypothetical protein HQL67_03950 [Magnetococcales bacterium]|nr:hypothetical protein [Magnetococcales bacterium]
MKQKTEELLYGIIGLIREGRVYDAQQALDSAIQERPELAAQWFIMARLLLLGGDAREKKYRQALQTFGLAAQRVFDDAMQMMDDRQEQIADQTRQIERLQLFLEGFSPAEPLGSVSGSLEPAARWAGDLSDQPGSAPGRIIEKLTRFSEQFSRSR